jgi:hypothetical protein
LTIWDRFFLLKGVPQPMKLSRQATFQETGSHDPGMTQVMIRMNKMVPKLLFGGETNHLDCQRTKIGNLAGNRFPVNLTEIGKYLSPPVK